MKHFNHMTIFLLIFSIFINALLAKDLQILDHETVELTNPHRANAKLKISFTGGNITHTDIYTSSSRKLIMDWDPKHPNNFGKNYVQIHNNSQTAKSIIYDFTWHHQSSTSYQVVCFDLGLSNKTSWFSTALEKIQPWPYNTGKLFSQSSKPAALKTGSYETENAFGPIVENVFLNSDGFALYFTQFYSPFVIRKGPENQLCMAVKPENLKESTIVSFVLYADEDVEKLHQHLIHDYHVIGRESAHPDERTFNHTSYTFDVRSLKQTEVLAKITELSSVYKLKNLQVVFEGWEMVMGDLKFDNVRFPDPATMVAEIHKLGYLVKLTVNSFYNSESEVFKSHPHFFLSDPKNRTFPYTFSWKDPSNPKSINQTGSLFNYPAIDGFFDHSRDWLLDRLKNISRLEKVDSFRLVGGDLGQFGVPESVRTDFLHAGHYSNLYTRFYSVFGGTLGSLVDIDAAYQVTSLNYSLRMRDIPADWTSLRNVIPQALTIGLAGHPFLVAPTLTSKPTEELYIRWLEMTTFFPSMQLSSETENLLKTFPKTANLTYTYLNLHSEHSATLIAVAKATSKSGGGPLLRPLWYLAPNDPKTYPIFDQFAFGNDLIVAPVLTAETKERSVYLPSGIWFDQHGKTHLGPAKVKVLAPLEELPYFKRKIV